jgi:hypothetical protein
MALPIAYTLNEGDMRARRGTIADAFRDIILDVKSLPLGYAYRFASTYDVLARIVSLVDVGRQRCPFLTFKIILAAGYQPLCLEITGPPGARAVIADLFGRSQHFMSAR